MLQINNNKLVTMYIKRFLNFNFVSEISEKIS